MGATLEDLSERDERLGAIVFACLQAIEQGRALDRRELLGRHPEFAAELTEFFAEWDDLRQLAAPLREVAQAARPRMTLDPGQPAGEDTAAWPAPPLPGIQVRRFGDFELLAVIGQGGNGVVYRARQLSVNRPVALKMIRAGVLADDAELRRFQNEAESVATLDHVGIVPVYEVGDHDGQKYFSMKLVPGGNLAQRLAAYRDDPRAAAALVAEAAEAVHHAHM